MGHDTRWIKMGLEENLEFVNDVIMGIHVLEAPSGKAAVEQVVNQIEEIIMQHGTNLPR